MVAADVITDSTIFHGTDKNRFVGAEIIRRRHPSGFLPGHLSQVNQIEYRCSEAIDGFTTLVGHIPGPWLKLSNTLPDP